MEEEMGSIQSPPDEISATGLRTQAERACGKCRHFCAMKRNGWTGELLGYCEEMRLIPHPYNGVTIYLDGDWPTTVGWTDPGFFSSESFCKHYRRRPWWLERKFQARVDFISKARAALSKGAE